MGLVSHFQRFSISDGPGVRTTVFLKGCPLRCAWCHNPETQLAQPQRLFYAERCKACGLCKTVCPAAKNSTACAHCGLCAEICPFRACEMSGTYMDAEEVMKRVLRDEDFYKASGGGMTVSGGEPLAQFDFTRQLLEKAKEKGLHTALDTSGYGGRAAELVGLVDLFLWDLKETDAQNHLRYTGAELEPIVEALEAVSRAGGKIRLRSPLIPGVNARQEHILRVMQLAQRLTGVIGVDLIAYHPLGIDKAHAIGREQQRFECLSQEQRQELLAAARQHTQKPVDWHM